MNADFIRSLRCDLQYRDKCGLGANEYLFEFIEQYIEYLKNVLRGARCILKEFDSI